MINAAHIFCLTHGTTRSWRNGDAQCCQLSNSADRFSDFFSLQKSAQTLFSLRELSVLPREVLLSFFNTHTPLSVSLSLSVCSVSVQRMHTPASAQFLFSACTHISLALSEFAQFLFSTCTHISLALSKSAQFLFSMSTHISLSLHVCSVYVQHAAEKSRA